MTSVEERVLVLAPTGRDGELLLQAMEKFGFQSEHCRTAQELLNQVDVDPGAILITEESVTPYLAAGLGSLADAQAAWSDLPVLLLTSDARRPSTPTRHLLKVAGDRGNVTLLERPIRIDTLLSTVTTALRSRRRQYEIRDYLEERRRHDEQLRQTQKLESIGLLAGGIAHDFNNLLTGIIGNTSLCMEITGAAPEQMSLLGEIMLAGKRAADLTAQLLAYAGKGRFVIRPFDLSQQIEEVASLIKSCIGKSTQLDLDLDQHLPLAEGDCSQIQQIVMNLIINAAESLPEGGTGRISVTTGVRTFATTDRDFSFLDGDVPCGSFVFLEVRDTGCGMTEDVLSRIFDPFYTTKFLGRGLGLAALTGIVRSHGGAVSVRSKPGEGTVFTVFFPVSTAARPEGVAVAHKSEPILSGTVLFVDDEQVVRTVAQQALTKRGLKVVLASNGEEAVEIFRAATEKISLVVLDLTMPVWSGEYTYGILHRLAPSLPVVLSSGYAESMLMERFADKGFAGFLQKPYTSRELVDKVASVLDGTALE